jgi:hypothetical protein
MNPRSSARAGIARRNGRSQSDTTPSATFAADSFARYDANARSDPVGSRAVAAREWADVRATLERWMYEAQDPSPPHPMRRQHELAGN